MKASDLLGRTVVDARGSVLGVVHDARVRLPSRHRGADPDDAVGLEGSGSRPALTELVVGPADRRCRLAHSWGYAQGGSRGPAVFRALLAGQGARTRSVPVQEVASWDDDGVIRTTGGSP